MTKKRKGMSWLELNGFNFKVSEETEKEKQTNSRTGINLAGRSKKTKKKEYGLK